MRTVTFIPSYRKIEVEPGSTILDAVQRAGLNINVVCGGLGKCGKCIVHVQSGKTNFDREKFGRFFTEDELALGSCLACQTTVESDLQVFIPESTLIQEQKILVDGQETAIEFHHRSGNIMLNFNPQLSPIPPRIFPGCSGASRKPEARLQKKCMLR